jgi:hypothetical protein
MTAMETATTTAELIDGVLVINLKHRPESLEGGDSPVLASEPSELIGSVQRTRSVIADFGNHFRILNTRLRGF